MRHPSSSRASRKRQHQADCLDIGKAAQSRAEQYR
jgi:hypothetical protein